MNIITELDDPLDLEESFSSIMNTQVTPHSKLGCPCNAGYTYINQDLSLIWGKYYNYSGIIEPKNIIYLCISIHEDGFIFDGNKIDGINTPLTVTLSRPGKQSFVSFPRPFPTLVVTIDYQKFTLLYEHLTQNLFEENFSISFLQLRSLEAKDELVKELTMLTKEDYLANFDNIERDEIADAMIEKIILSVETKSVNLDRNYCNALAIRVYTYIVTNKVEEITITKLCQVMNASARSIHKGFNELYGMGPIEFDRIFRLFQLRRHIKKYGLAHGELTTLMGIFGFSHAGRLSQNYKKMFGVLPSKDKRLGCDPPRFKR